MLFLMFFMKINAFQQSQKTKILIITFILIFKIFINQNKEYSIMKNTNISREVSKKKKNHVHSMDRLPNFYNNARTANSSQGQSPFASFRMSCKNGSILNRNRYQSHQDIRKSAQYSNKKRQLEYSKQKQNKMISNKNFLSNNFNSYTMTPKVYQTQGNQQQNSLNRSNFKFMYQIGFGGFGKVWKVQQKISWEYYAMKQIQKRRVLDKDSVQCIMNERKVLSQLNHPFLVNMKLSFQDKNCLYLIMDYLKGADLRYHICYRQFFSQAQTKFILACLIIALEQIHSKGIVHRDIKPQNLVLEETGYVRLTDFGIAKYTHEIKAAKYDSSGTPGYMAPEVLLKEAYNEVSDYFALGVVGYELMLNKRPYVGKNRNQIKQKICHQQVKISQQQIPMNWSRQSADFINKLIKKKAQQRLGSKQGIKSLKQHTWMKDINWKKLSKKQLLPPFIPNIICETKQYLEEIQSYNEMNQEEITKILIPLSNAEQKLFEGYGGKGVVSSFGQPFRNLRNTIEKNVKNVKSKKLFKLC